MEKSLFWCRSNEARLFLIHLMIILFARPFELRRSRELSLALMSWAGQSIALPYHRRTSSKRFRNVGISGGYGRWLALAQWLLTIKVVSPTLQLQNSVALLSLLRLCKGFGISWCVMSFARTWRLTYHCLTANAWWQYKAKHVYNSLLSCSHIVQNEHE